MADYTSTFSFVLPIVTDTERTWATTLIDAVQAWDEHTPAGWLDQVLGSDFGDIGVELSLEAEGLWVHSGTCGDAAHAIRLTRHYLATFRPSESIGIEWANTCSAPRTDGFGGGAARVTATGVHSMTTATWLDQRAGVVTVPYTVPVSVDVNLDSGQVVSVRVIDEQVERDEPLGVRDSSWNEIHDPDVYERAVAIAENDEWPSWEFGA